MTRIRLALAHLFNLRHDQDTPDMIDETIRSGVAVSGTNLWVLIFAILIASIGLNVNSTAVIIGAMLISPLMGPIVAIGYGAGVKDIELIKLSLRNLGTFVAISLCTASVYFLLSPLTDAQSELLARTSPTLWDVLIAFFGGAVGMIAATRRYSSNVVPGVAIATALMPPLCTAGYGIANGNLQFISGALYLFAINSVFIAFASLLVAKLLRLPHRGQLDDSAHHRARLMIGIVVALTLIPSGFLAYDLVVQKVFDQTASRIAQGIGRDKRYILLGQSISPVERSITLTMGGDVDLDLVRTEVERQFAASGAQSVNVTIRRVGSEKFDVTQLKQDLQKEVFSNTWRELQDSLAQSHRLELENQALKGGRFDRQRLIKEIAAQYPEASRITVGDAKQASPGQDEPRELIVVMLSVAKPIPEKERNRLKAWLSARFDKQDIELVVSQESTKPPPGKSVAKNSRSKRR